MAQVICDLPADAVVLAFGVNTYFQGNQAPAAFGDRYAAFLDAIRNHRTDLPLVIITPTCLAAEPTQVNLCGARLEEYRQAIRETVGRRQSEGDASIRLTEGASIIGPGDEDRLADGVHPNDQGMAAFAARLTPVLAAVLPERSGADQR
jgi:lysophospholipase L1-like esterase